MGASSPRVRISPSPQVILSQSKEELTMNQNKLKKPTQEDITELNETIIQPAMNEVEKLHIKTLDIIRFKYENKLKNIDSVIDVVKILLPISGSLVIASISIPQLKISIYTTVLSFILFVILMFLLLWMRRRTNDSYISEYKKFSEEHVLNRLNRIEKMIKIAESKMQQSK